VKLGIENRRQTIVAAVLGALLLGIVAYEAVTSSSTNASTTAGTNSAALQSSVKGSRQVKGHAAAVAGKKQRPEQDLDPTLHLRELASTEQIKYEGSGRNIFVAQADTEIPKPLAPGVVGQNDPKPFQIPAVAPAPPIPLKFFGFASHPGEPKKIFLSKGDDVFIAGEGEIVDRRYKVVRISPTSVEIQDVVGSGPPQTLPLTQG
jgi:hypothetical protein